MKLAAFLSAQAITQPDRKALVCGEASMTFRELHEASDRLAVGLRNSGVVIGDRVAMLLPNCCEFVMLFVAIVKCGAIALPLNKRLSGKELSLILADAEPAAIFFEAADRSLIASITDGINIRRCVMGPLAEESEIALATLLESDGGVIDVPRNMMTA